MESSCDSELIESHVESGSDSDLVNGYFSILDIESGSDSDLVNGYFKYIGHRIRF